MWRNVGLYPEGFRKISGLPLAISNPQHTTQFFASRIRPQQWRGIRTILQPRRPISSVLQQIREDQQKDKLSSWHKRYASSLSATRWNIQRRHKSSLSNEADHKTPKISTTSPSKSDPSTSLPPKEPPTTPPTHTTPILERLTKIHTPTKEELLAAATGFWSRISVRFKWFSIRSNRPFSLDEIFGFLSWIFVGHLVWVIVGTTTFFSLAILAVNTVFAQETLAQWIGEYLTRSSGLQVVFEEAIVPKWGDGVISFSNVFLSRRPGRGKAKVIKGSSSEAAANAELAKKESEEDDGNYTQFDVTIETVNVTLSFAKWFNGRGILKDVEMKGVRGVIDRTHVHETGHWGDPKTYRREHNTGDFELDSFKMDNLLLTVHQPGNFRPFNVSIFSCDLPQLRQQWLFYDFLSAHNISGSIDNSLFTLHPRQSVIAEAEKGRWKKESRLRIDGLHFDHLNRGAEGPFSWIREGNVDIVADMRFPADDDESVVKVLSDVLDRVEATVSAANTGQDIIHPDHPSNSNTPESDSTNNHEGEHTAPTPLTKHDEALLVMDIRVTMNDVRAGVPIFTKEISYVNNALIRPIVAYINSRRAFIPVSCRVVKGRSEFDGAWTAWDSGMLDDVNKEVSIFKRQLLESSDQS
jgi:distribution and morphology protein 31